MEPLAIFTTTPTTTTNNNNNNFTEIRPVGADLIGVVRQT